jgi:hypothetical protein
MKSFTRILAIKANTFFGNQCLIPQNCTIMNNSFPFGDLHSLALAFNSTFQYIDNILSINKNQFHSYVDLIYPNNLETKDTIECSSSVSYLDVLLKLDTNCKRTTQFNDKRDDFNFSIVNFPYLCSNIPASPT